MYVQIKEEKLFFITFVRKLDRDIQVDQIERLYMVHDTPGN
jgi:hypothetical protein